MKRLLMLALFLPLAANAQEKTYTITVTHSELGVIGNALSERPYKEVNGVITSLARQVQTQNEAAQQSVKAKDKPPTDEGLSK